MSHRVTSLMSTQMFFPCQSLKSFLHLSRLSQSWNSAWNFPFSWLKNYWKFQIGFLTLNLLFFFNWQNKCIRPTSTSQPNCKAIHRPFIFLVMLDASSFSARNELFSCFPIYLVPSWERATLLSFYCQIFCYAPIFSVRRK